MKEAVAAGVNGNCEGSKVPADGRDALVINANKARQLRKRPNRPAAYSDVKTYKIGDLASM